jgi:hypothetical protein
MKTVRLLFLLAIASMSITFSRAQSDTAIALQQATVFADSLVKTYRFESWNEYLSLSYAGAIKYYGGKSGFLLYVQRTRALYRDSLEEKPETVRLIQLENDINHWQCVMEKSREAYWGGRPVKTLTYMVGQSRDNGITWKFFDVGHNSIENIIYIMPEIFGHLSIPKRKIIYLDEPAVVQQKKPEVKKSKSSSGSRNRKSTAKR